MNPTRTTTTALITLLASTLHAHAGVVDCQPTPSSEWTQTIRNVCYDPQFGPTTTVEGGFPSFVDLQADVYHCLTYFNTIYTYGVFEGSQFEGTPTEWVGHGILVRLVHAYNLDHGTQKRIAVGVGPADPWSVDLNNYTIAIADLNGLLDDLSSDEIACITTIVCGNEWGANILDHWENSSYGLKSMMASARTMFGDTMPVTTRINRGYALAGGPQQGYGWGNWENEPGKPTIDGGVHLQMADGNTWPDDIFDTINAYDGTLLANDYPFFGLWTTPVQDTICDTGQTIWNLAADMGGPDDFNYYSCNDGANVQATYPYFFYSMWWVQRNYPSLHYYIIGETGWPTDVVISRDLGPPVPTDCNSQGNTDGDVGWQIAKLWPYLNTYMNDAVAGVFNQPTLHHPTGCIDVCWFMWRDAPWKEVATSRALDASWGLVGTDAHLKVGMDWSTGENYYLDDYMHPTEAQQLYGDANLDGIVNVLDIAAAQAVNNIEPTDVNRDGVTNIYDLLEVLQDWSVVP